MADNAAEREFDAAKEEGKDAFEHGDVGGFLWAGLKLQRIALKQVGVDPTVPLEIVDKAVKDPNFGKAAAELAGDLVPGAVVIKKLEEFAKQKASLAEAAGVGALDKIIDKPVDKAVPRKLVRLEGVERNDQPREGVGARDREVVVRDLATAIIDHKAEGAAQAKAQEYLGKCNFREQKEFGEAMKQALSEKMGKTTFLLSRDGDEREIKLFSEDGRVISKIIY